MNRLNQLASLFQRTHDVLGKRGAHAVDSFLVVKNWLFGWYLVEFENTDAARTDIYGKKLVENLANQLKKKGLHGCSAPNLNRFRRFYLEHQEIRSTLSIESSDMGPDGTDLLDAIQLRIAQSLPVDLIRVFPSRLVPLCRAVHYRFSG
jgi:hypothetical protein